ncbi:PEP-CTERM sorting domain-containing protein [Pelomonas sp. KK5]|uniref:PEP-CTERM sorting domain-containing protein n=1 Tax=Pelomonas sp. KK5 TaxID=1855730 RepID=UPI00097C0B19|nr:PEP-CTERM sorting domain-containing protein [Pelomonas sp. KK5]
MNKFLTAAALATASLSASASLTPAYDTFGTLSAATFGGTGISNKAVAIDTFTGRNLIGQSTGTITLGLTATSRYANQPSVSNNGAGVFYATAGVDKTSPLSILDQLATWNLDFYIGGATSSNPYVYKLLVDVDPSAGENFKTFYLGANSQDSWNLGAASLELLGGYSFNPTRTGDYSVVLEAVNMFTGSVAGSTSILVDVRNVPEPASLALVGVALIGLAASARRRRG